MYDWLLSVVLLLIWCCFGVKGQKQLEENIFWYNFFLNVFRPSWEWEKWVNLFNLFLIFSSPLTLKDKTWHIKLFFLNKFLFFSALSSSKYSWHIKSVRMCTEKQKRVEDEYRKWAGDDDDARGSEFFVWVTTCCVLLHSDVTVTEECLWFPRAVRTVMNSKGHRYMHTQELCCVSFVCEYHLVSSLNDRTAYAFDVPDVIWQIYDCYVYLP